MGTWPEEDFSIRVKVLIREVPSDRIGQIFSAWAGAMDDPLRLVVDGGKLFARIEAGTTFSTPGVVVATDRWYAIVAVKRGSTLTLYLDDRSVGSCTVPEFSNTQAFDFALGGNPHFGGNEFLPAKFADLEFVARAVEPDGGPPRNVR